MTVVCYLSSVLAHTHVLVKMHNVLHMLHASTESPRCMVEKGALSGLHQLWLIFLHCDARLFLTCTI